MANNRFNKQVTPKGYKKGGSVKKDYKLGTKFQGDYKGKSVPGKVKEFVKTGVKQTIGTVKKIGKKFRTKKMGGGMMKRPMYKDGTPKKRGKDFMSSSMKDARSVAGKSGGADSGKTGEARSKAGVQEVRIKKGIKKFGKKVKDIATLKKFHDFAEKRARKGSTGKGTDEPIRTKKAMGGSLKPVDKEKNPGLSKLPTKVRNKMGFMKKGGKVK